MWRCSRSCGNGWPRSRYREVRAWRWTWTRYRFCRREGRWSRPPTLRHPAAMLSNAQIAVKRQDQGWSTPCSTQSTVSRRVTHLPGRHLPRRPDRKLQHFAKRGQIGICRAAMIRLPIIDAGGGDADALGDFTNRKMTFDPCVAEIASKTWLAGQCIYPFRLETWLHSVRKPTLQDGRLQAGRN